MMVFLSLLLAIAFGFLAILTLNYTVYLWENKKVNDLTSKIRPRPDTFSQKSSFSENFSSLDLGSSLNKNKALQVATDIYNRTVVSITKQEYPGWINKIIEEFNLFRKNAFAYIARFFKYLLTLTKPVDETKIEPEVIRSENDTTTNPAKAEYVDPSEALPVSNNKEYYSDVPEKEVKDVDYQTPSQSVKKEEGFATIGFAASNSTGKKKSDKDMSVFEKLEARILEKLKTSGLNHYDIWLELGSLYEKYDEKEKAVEIYALILKHSEGREKDIARDKLIGLS